MFSPGMLIQRTFEKELPGADCTFQPDDLSDYADDPWDIRISIADSPLDEAFYITVEDPSAARKTIRMLLLDYALNPENRHLLDVDDYPDLPYLQSELIQYQQNAKQGLLQIDYFVNHAPEPGPVDLNRRAADYLSCCTYHDRSHDYLVLDLVLVPSVAQRQGYDTGRLNSELGGVFLLKLIDRCIQQGDTDLAVFMQTAPVKAFVQGTSSQAYGTFIRSMQRLVLDGYATRTHTGSEYALEMTEHGLAMMTELNEASLLIEQQYDLFDSVGIAPPALGIPDGFDARVQMMEYERMDCERSVLLRILDMDPSLYAEEHWLDSEGNFACLPAVFEAMAYKTNFSREILNALKLLAEPPP